MARITKCKECLRPILMAYVLPPGEYKRRWLPFNDRGLTSCHLDTCDGNVKKFELYCYDCSKSISATRKEWMLRTCPECGSEEAV